MIQNRSILEVADNSGAKKLMVIGIPGRSRQRFAYLGDIVSAVVKKADPRGVVKSSDVVRAVLVRSKKEFRRRDGSYIRFDENSAVVIDSSGNPKGSRIFGPIAREVRERGYLRIASLAPEVI
ncbi:MAG: 50S ribosomal protein L14 [Candidatus Woykebacteria bacterium RIFCSPLOWO2_01_FULL_41_12]|uniref:Large ribosomal subunit protein uL14 n=2 Tax=Microgenomates group TaxID=1794810 RepID=A0A0H4T1N0_9BACT|nr:50S ribosomal protein L14 [uncultured Microgenomates bacterium Rifle_16ft_4_minimus_19697]OGY30568.1 MAG: 50S ribosomal protein L14 [Candidatus Woykebacteria bacterium RIFCSPLOWO2_01_FULL_41_12]